MLIYHGTTLNNLKSILADGIKPRGRKKSNWKKAPSREDMVYLTTAYPFYFARCVTDYEDIGVVFEIDLKDIDSEWTFPDEDFIWEGLKKEIAHERIRQTLETYQQTWLLSLEKLGNCCYKGRIPPSNIKRYCIFNFKKRMTLSMSMMDPSICTMNFFIKGIYYQDIVRWCFGDIPLLPHVQESELYFDNFGDAIFAQRTELWKKESKDRTGVEVVCMK